MKNTNGQNEEASRTVYIFRNNDIYEKCDVSALLRLI